MAGVAPAEIGMAGLKDRQGVTVQFMSVKGGKPVFLKTPELRIEPAGFAAHELSSSSSLGNASLSGALLSLALERSDVEPTDPLVPTVGLEFRPRLLHRLDKDTTGVVLVAKTLEAERELRAAFDEGRVRKSYLALVEGEYPLADGETEIIDLPIGPDERKSGRMRVDKDNGKESQTRVGVEQRFSGYTLMRCEPLTGRTHQIRVNLREVGIPLVVDPVYGRHKTLSLSEFKRDYRKKRGQIESPLIERLTLHAQKIEFPRVGGPGSISVESPLPRDFARVLKQMSKVRAR
jgi:RluA family pseudouridine synthase